MSRSYKLLWVICLMFYWYSFLDKHSIFRFIIAMLFTSIFMFLILAEKEGDK